MLLIFLSLLTTSPLLAAHLQIAGFYSEGESTMRFSRALASSVIEAFHPELDSKFFLGQYLI